MNVHHRNLRRVVIIGGGFGGLSTARALKGASVRVTLLDRQNHHLFQPLLYQVATAGLSAVDICQPIRAIFAERPNFVVVMGEVEEIDLAGKRIRHSRGELTYDSLVLAAGGVPS